MRFTGERIKFHFNKALSFFHNEEQTLRLTSASSSADSTLLIQFRSQKHYNLQYVGQQLIKHESNISYTRLQSAKITTEILADDTERLYAN